jgi:thiamine-phosphate pyrophosphorylase
MSPPELRERLSLIVIADPTATGGRSLVDVVRGALAGGAPAVQLRAKAASTRELAELGRVLRQESLRSGALLFINDRVDVALAVDADGAHLGDDDLPLSAARAIVPRGFLLGRSVDVPEEVPAAIRGGADYLGVGPVRATGSKLDVGAPIGKGGVRAVVAAAGDVPVVGIGGITAADVPLVLAAGAAGVAVISSVMGAADPEAAVRELLRAVERPL